MQTYKVTVDNNGTIRWYNEGGKLHRLDGPAIEWANGSKFYYINGKLHRENGPAVEWEDGTKEYFINNKRHRLDGPAVEFPNGYKAYYFNGKLHREDGPAIVYSYGRKQYWIDGVRLSEEEFVNYNKKIQVYKVIVDDNGIIRWYNEEGKLQRIDGPPGPLYEYSKKMTIGEI